MDEKELIEQRKEQFKEFLTKNKSVTIFSILAAITLIITLFVKFNIQIPILYKIGAPFGPMILFLLAIGFLISAILAYKDYFKLMFLPILAWIVYIASFIRTRNLPGLRDVVTGGWTLGPDLDPFLFLRWAKDIVKNGTLMALDTMRYVPIGFETTGEMKLLSYMMAWFHQVASIFNPEMTVTHSAVIYPVFFFALTAIAFFLMVKKIFETGFKNQKYPYIIASIATALLVVLPSLLARTIAGIPEKESTGFFFLFLTFYLFISAWKSKTFKKSIIYGILAGASTGLMALVWGGSVFLYMTISISALLYFIFKDITKKQLTVYLIWVLTFMSFLLTFSTRVSLKDYIISTSTGLAFFVLFIFLIDFFLFKSSPKLKQTFNKINLPKKLISIIVSIILISILAFLLLGPTFFTHKANDIIDQLITPFGTDRFTLTVAENRQPYFSGEWAGEFGPIIKNIPLSFLLFFIGAVTLFYYTFKFLESRERLILTGSFTVFLFGLVFSRYSSSSSLNGTSPTSLLLYFGGIILLLFSFIYILYIYRTNNKTNLFKKVNFSYLLLITMTILAIIAARGAVRLIMILTPFATVMISFLIIILFLNYSKSKNELRIIFLILFVASVFLAGFIFYNDYQQTAGSAAGFVPSIYTHQWQKAMAWVRDNTPENSVFAHWWDYGYWVQSMGERATVLDGGNVHVYWNHLMGRHVLTGQSEQESFDYLYSHNATHLLIDSTDLGKYTAFSLIGADTNFDRYSFMPSMVLDHSNDQEKRNSTLHFYQGGFSNDDDIMVNQDGKDVFIPAKASGVAGVLVTNDNGVLKNPEAIIIFQNQQFTVPMKYLYYDGQLHEYEGISAGLFVFPRLIPADTGSVTMDPIGAAVFLNGRTVNSNLARLYLFNQSENYKLVHTEQDVRMQDLKNNGMQIGDFAYFNGLIGPIKIWEINYPENVQYDDKYLLLEYPDDALRSSS
ncbi:MAG: hypothetical protein KKF56_01500 [Nanoarchaeota archaeon]|nr:hypothetical protein [Nanoarchaeota archaeon]